MSRATHCIQRGPATPPTVLTSYDSTAIIATAPMPTTLSSIDSTAPVVNRQVFGNTTVPDVAVTSANAHFSPSLDVIVTVIVLGAAVSAVMRNTPLSEDVSGGTMTGGVACTHCTSVAYVVAGPSVSTQ